MGTFIMKFAVVLLVSQAVSLTKPKEEYPAWMHGFGGYHQYMRDVPDRFESEADDTLHEIYVPNLCHRRQDRGMAQWSLLGVQEGCPQSRPRNRRYSSQAPRCRR